MKNAFLKNLFSTCKTKIEKNNFINFVYELNRFKGLLGFGTFIGTVLLYQRFYKGSFYIKDKKNENQNDEFYSIDDFKDSILYTDKSEDFYAKEFKDSVEEKNFQKQIESLKSLGNIYLRKAKQVSKSTAIEEKYFYLINFNKAIALYNAAFTRSKNKNDQEEITKLTKTAEYLFLQNIGISDKSKVSTSKSDFQHRNELKEIRNSIINKLNSIKDEAKAWQHRPLDSTYPILYLDAMVIKIREGKQIVNKSLHMAMGIDMNGNKDILGLWLANNEGSKFWLSVLNELKNRGVNDIFIACCDGLTGFPEAINAVFPKTTVQLCIVHMIRNSTKFVSYKDLKVVAADLKQIYTAINEEQASIALLEFADKWDKKYPMISASWTRH